MIGLAGLWLLSLALSAVALMIMTGLIIGRWFGERRASEYEAERRRLIPLLLGAEPSLEQFHDVEPARPLLVDLAVEFIQLVRGSEKENFVASATRLGVPLRLRQQLRSGRPRMRIRAADALADFISDDTVAALRDALDDRNAEVRLTAAMSLAAMDRSPPALTLVSKLHIGTNENSMLVVGLFEEIARTRAGEIRQLIEDPDVAPPVKAAAIDALASSGDYSLVPIISQLAQSADPFGEELPRYLRALGGFGHPAAAAAVQQSLDAPTWWARASAAEAAGRIGLIESAPRLAQMLSDGDWWVRFRAGEALVKLGPVGQEILSHCAAEDSPMVSQAARLTLAERGIRT